MLRLGFASATPHLRLDYALASISCEHYRVITLIMRLGTYTEKNGYWKVDIQIRDIHP